MSGRYKQNGAQYDEQGVNGGWRWLIAKIVKDEAVFKVASSSLLKQVIFSVIFVHFKIWVLSTDRFWTGVSLVVMNPTAEPWPKRIQLVSRGCTVDGSEIRRSPPGIYKP